jgi:hypothetical protein
MNNKELIDNVQEYPNPNKATDKYFNQNVYVDLRVTKNVWDDAKTLSAKEVSSNYFKVPTLQLSLGYRFKKFSTDN